MHVLVIGDLFLDRYVYHDPTLGSPSLETGLIPIISVKESFSPGAAGNVAKNLSLLGVDVFLISVIGDDGNALELTRALENFNVNTSYLIKMPKRPTPVYTKFVNILTYKEDLPRLDVIPRIPLDQDIVNSIVSNLKELIKQVDAVIVVDQFDEPDLGVITDEVKHHIDHLKSNFPNKIFVADSRMRPHFFKSYTLKPNSKEFEEILKALHFQSDLTPSPILIQRHAVKVSKILKSDLVITAGEDGAYVVDGNDLFRLYSNVSEVVDVCGAGDAFLSAFVVAFIKERDVIKASLMGMKAGKLCVSQLGTGEIKMEDLSKIPDPKIERVISKEIFVNIPKKITDIKFALFDFDGTISLLREGWQPIMKEVMIEEITGGKKLAEDNLKKIEKDVEDYIDRTTGQQTILQMMELEKMVKKYGFVDNSAIKTPFEYKSLYNERLKRIVRKRMKEEKPRKFLLSGAFEFLKTLYESNISLFLFSGTDVEDVIEEARFLGIEKFFNGIHGASSGDYKKHSKENVVRRLIVDNNLKGNELLIVGDGPVEISVGRTFGAFTIGVASNEKQGYGWDVKKFRRLKNHSANIIIPDFTPITPKFLNEFMDLH